MKKAAITFNQTRQISLTALLFALYYLAAPMEDLLTGAMGTVQKYIAIVIVLVEIAKFDFHISLPKNRFTHCMIWLMALAVISCFWSVDLGTTWERLFAYLTVPGFCLFATALGFNEREYRLILNAALLGGIIVFFFIIEKETFYGNTFRTTLSESNDPNNLAALLLLPFGISFDRLIKRNGLWRLMYIVLVGAFTYALLLTGSRGGMLAMLMFVGAYLLQGNWREKWSKLLLLGIVVATAYFVLVPLLPDTLRLRMFSVESYTGTGAGRTEIWKTVITKVLPDSWLLGNGAGCVCVRLIPYYGFRRGVHNTYLNMLGEYGILGLPVFLIMLSGMLKKQVKTKRTVEAALLAGIFVAIFFLDAYAKKFFWNIMMLACIAEKTTVQQKAAAGETGEECEDLYSSVEKLHVAPFIEQGMN